MTLIRMLFGIVAGIVYIWTLDIYVLRQIGQISGQIGQKNLNVNHMYIQYDIRWVFES
jgi:hypothetical protein